MRLWHLVFLGAKVVFEAGMSLSLIFTGLEADKRNKPEMSQLLKAGLSYLGIVKLLLSGICERHECRASALNVARVP